MQKLTQSEIVSFLKNYGFVYPNSEIYNGLANAWDYGPAGVLLKQNIKQSWWEYFITSRANVVGLDSNIIYNAQVWKASGHLQNFTDPLIDCKQCKIRIRADKLIEEFDEKIEVSENDTTDALFNIIQKNKIHCPNCQGFDWTAIRKFNLMFKTFQGVLEDDANTLYLRPETAQGIFINFKNVLRTNRLKVPFGIGQTGKAFRNEITPGNFIFRTREFEQMELEYFIHPDTCLAQFEEWNKNAFDFLTNVCSLSKENLRTYSHPKDKLSHYSKMTNDIQFLFPHGWSELCGIAHRGNYDLSVHEKVSGKDLTYLDPTTNERYLPHVIEPSFGLDRLFYAVITNALKHETIKEDDIREVLCLPINLCPYKVAVLPLTNKLNEPATNIFNQLLKNKISCLYDTSGSIGKRYRRQDAIGTMYCITIDFDTIDVQKQTITIRHRDSMQQETIKLDELQNYLSVKLK